MGTTRDVTQLLVEWASGDQQALDKLTPLVYRVKDFRQVPYWGDWGGLAPDDSPLLLRDAGTHDIYALDWQAP